MSPCCTHTTGVPPGALALVATVSQRGPPCAPRRRVRDDDDDDDTKSERAERLRDVTRRSRGR